MEILLAGAVLLFSPSLWPAALPLSCPEPLKGTALQGAEAFKGRYGSAVIVLRSPQRCLCALLGSAGREARLGWALGHCQALCCTSSEASGYLQQPAPLTCI